jgi:hypothetical protein
MDLADVSSTGVSFLFNIVRNYQKNALDLLIHLELESQKTLVTLVLNSYIGKLPLNSAV